MSMKQEDRKRQPFLKSAVAGTLALPMLLSALPEAPAATRAPAKKTGAQPRSRLTALPRAQPQSRITMDFRDAPLDQILNFFSVITGLTVIKDPGLQGTATLISPRPVPVEDALKILEALLDSRGFRLERTPTMLRVASKGGGGGGSDAGRRGPRGGGNNEGGPGGFGGLAGGRRGEQTRVFQLQYARAQGISSIVNDLFRTTATNNRGGRNNNNNNNNNNNQAAALPQVARASADEYSNSVIVMGPQTQIDLVENIIQQIDKPIGANQVTQVFPLRYVDANEMSGVISNVLTASVQQGAATTPVTLEQRVNNRRRDPRNPAAANGNVVAHAQTNSVVVTAPEESLDLVQEVIKELDKPQEIQSTTFVRSMKNASATEVAQMLNQIYARQGMRNNNFNNQRNNQGNRNNNFNRNNNQGNRNNNFNRNNGFNNNRQRGGTIRRSLSNDVPNASGQPGESPVRIASATPLAPGPSATEGEEENSDGESSGVSASAASGAEQPNERVMLAQGPGGPGGFFGGFNPFGGFQGGFGGGFGGGAAAGQLQAVPDVNTNSIIINADPATMAALDQILASLDRAPEQVLIEAVIVEANLDDSSKLGFQFQWTQPNLGGSTIGAGETNVQPGTGFSPTGLRYSIIGNSFSAILQALSTDRRFNILSTPRIFTANNRQAQINISQQIPYITSTIVNPTGTTQNAFDFLDVGIILDVTPRITANGLVTIDVLQTANDFQGFTEFNAPLISQRSTTTTVVVQDGQTVIIGGLIRTTNQKTRSKVPILGDLPLVGGLFRSTEDVKQKTELMVFLTPHIVRTADEISDLTEQQRNQLQFAPRVPISRPSPALPEVDLGLPGVPTPQDGAPQPVTPEQPETPDAMEDDLDGTPPNATDEGGPAIEGPDPGNGPEGPALPPPPIDDGD